MKIGLALGAGGARGLAFIVILEAFEELGIKPSIISGASIGAIVGAAYAAGLDTKQMRAAVDELVETKNGRFWEIYKKSDLIKLLEFIDPNTKSGGILKGEKIINYFKSHVKIKKFEELKIPLLVVATNYWEKKQEVLSKGDLLSAVKASYSLPGIFTPVSRNGKLLIDGGMVNPLPFDVISEKCDLTIAIDVSAKLNNKDAGMPPAHEVLFSAFQIMQNSILSAKLMRSTPNILIKTDIKEIRMLEFLKAKEIYKQAVPFKDQLKSKLELVLKKKPYLNS
ncbi:MAG: patatin-like phospholipase family protein [Melioribacteraceae bacterium]|nr:patatin-like phospholipase family protein [Melioribacteraceae bacterium]